MLLYSPDGGTFVSQLLQSWRVWTCDMTILTSQPPEASTSHSWDTPSIAQHINSIQKTNSVELFGRLRTWGKSLKRRDSNRNVPQKISAISSGSSSSYSILGEPPLSPTLHNLSKKQKTNYNAEHKQQPIDTFTHPQWRTNEKTHTHI